jgi:TrmH family RNA methyltransferase
MLGLAQRRLMGGDAARGAEGEAAEAAEAPYRGPAQSLAKTVPGLDAQGLLALARWLSRDEEGPLAVREAAGSAFETLSGLEGERFTSGSYNMEAIRAVDGLRHAILRELGAPLADWDLIDPASGALDPLARAVNPGMELYLEDIRSPFNVGTVFRTAEAFGVERVVVSGRCADPEHPRAQRSAMGCVSALPWSRCPEDSRPDLSRAFALELGGTPIDEFAFPERGLCVLGSEELGVRPETIAACALGSVSIPMSGAKASLNVAVATGILLHEWSRAIHRARPHSR